MVRGEKSKNAPVPKHNYGVYNVHRLGMEGRTHPGSVWIWHKQFPDGSQQICKLTCIGVWPEKIDSDRGSQLVGAERELKEAWKKIDWKSSQRSSAQNDRINLGIWSCWYWYKKAVESLTKEAKCSIHFSVSNQGLSVHEFLTVLQWSV